MALKLSKFEIGMIAAFVVVTGAGIGGYFYTDGLLQDSKNAMNDAGSNLQKLLKQRYLPSDSNIKTLDANIAELQGAIKPVEEKVLAPSGQILGKITAQNPVTWKNSDLDQTVQKLTALAHAKRVALPADYYFGFSRYQKGNPSESATLILGKQLYGIEQLTTIIFQAGEGGAIPVLKGLRRTFDEDGSVTDGSRPTPGPAEAAELLKGSMQTSSNGLYRVYPFEVEFVSTSYGLRAFLNALMEAPVPFIVRSLQVTNSKMESPRLSDLFKPTQPDSRSDAALGTGRDFVFGGEQLIVRVRVDMVEWLGAKGAETAKPARAGKQPAK